MSAPAERPPRGLASTGQVFRSGMLVIGPDKPRLLLSALMSFATGLLETALLYLVAVIAITLSGGRELVQVGPHSLGLQLTVGNTVLAALGIVGALLAISFPLSSFLASLSSRAMVRLRTGLLRAYLQASVGYRDTHREGYLQQLMGEYSQRAENSVQQLATFCVTLCALSMVILGAIISTPLVAGGLLLGLALSAAIITPLAKRIKGDTLAGISINREVISHVAQTTRLSEEIAAFNVGERLAGELSHGLRRAAEAMHKLRYESRLVPNLYQYGTLGIVLILIGVLSARGSGNLSGLAPLALLLIRALAYVRQIQRALHSARETAPYIDALYEELDALKSNTPPAGSLNPARFEGMRFENVSYEYKPGEPVLQNVSFEIRRGEVLGVVGPSGSGKSTLSGLILRLRFATAGKVTADGVSLESVSAESWSRVSAFVPQDSRLIFGTVADNIRFLRDGFSDSDVMAAARAAHLHDEIMELPEGFATLIGPGARGLSGGQRQRLAIARALVAKPDLIIMDEPTSALDQRSELLVGQTLAELKGKVTIVLIAHRPATLGICDRIFRVTKGLLSEEKGPLLQT